MDQNTQNQIAQYYAKLPPNVQTMFSSMTWMETLRAISDTHKFSQAQNETVSTETTLVLLGMISLDEYKEILSRELGLETETFNQIFKEIETQVITPIRSELIQTHEQNKTDLVTEKYGTNLDERFEKLPNDVKAAIGSVDYTNTIVAIGKKNNLTAEQMGTLEEETTKVMLGVSHPTEFREQLLARLGVSRQKVDMVVTDTNSMIFSQIRESFQSMMEKPQAQDSSKYQVVSIKEDAVNSVVNEDTNAPKDLDVGEFDRDELLSQIENPAKSSIQNTVSSIKYPVLSEESIVEIPTPVLKPESPTPVVSVPETVPTPEIPQKPVSAVPNFLADKLGGTTITTPTTTDHSLPGMTTAPEDSVIPVRPADPYHEPID